MPATRKTIDFLRQLTVDGILSGEEVWALAKFLNENEECQKTWPGNLLFPMLHSAYDDGKVNEEEMSVLASTIAEIEQEWLNRNPVPKADSAAPAENLPPVAKPTMPQVPLEIPVPSQREDLVFTVNLADHSCTCPDWEKRRPWPAGHPGRCCKHVAYAFARTGKILEPWLQAVLDDCFRRGRGTNPGDDWIMIKGGDKKPVVFCGGENEWCTVFAPGSDGYERFGYNRSRRSWSYGDAPADAPLVEQAILNTFTS